jgi:hypothetical protein
MELTTYLSMEFEVAPRLFRNVAVFLSIPENLKNITSPVQSMVCPHCDSGNISVEGENCTNGRRFIAVCGDCNKPAGPAQKTEFLAHWKTVPKAQRCDIHSALVKKEVLDATFKKWARKPSHAHAEILITWIASLNLVKNMWADHKKTTDYKSLSEAEQCVMEAVGVNIDLLKAGARARLDALGVDFLSADVLDKLARAELDVRHERKSVLPRVKHSLSSSFFFAVNTRLSA